MEQLICHDCKCELKEGDEYMGYMNVDFVKCRKCHEKDPVLRNFQETEVYSRIVGYIRPVKQWNKGSQAQFGDRKTYKIKNEA